MRAAISGVRPGDRKRFKETLDVVREINPEAADWLQARVADGGHLVSVDRAPRRSAAENFDQHDSRRVADTIRKVQEAPGVKTAVNAWDTYTHTVFNKIAGRIEARFQEGMAGASIRQNIPKDLDKRSSEAMRQYMEGYRGTNEQAQLGIAVADMYGRYAGRTAGTAGALVTYVPFANWLINATHFTLRSLPRDHPAAVALATAAGNAIQDMYDKEEGLPAFMRGMIKANGGRVNIGKLFPVGAFTNPGDTIANQVLPQVGSAIKELGGTDWKGKERRDKDGNPISSAAAAAYAAWALLNGMVPFLGPATRVVNKGPATLSPIKTIKPPKKKPRKRKPRTLPQGTGLDLIFEDAQTEILPEAAGLDLIFE